MACKGVTHVHNVCTTIYVQQQSKLKKSAKIHAITHEQSAERTFWPLEGLLKYGCKFGHDRKKIGKITSVSSRIWMRLYKVKI